MLGSLVFLVASCGQVPSAESLVEKQEQALKQIHAMRATIECRVSRDAGKTWRLVYRFKVSRSGAKQRFRRYFAARLVDGEYQDSPDFGDFLETEDERLSVAGIDPDHPPVEPVPIIDPDRERRGQRVSGRIAPAGPLVAGGYMNQWMLPVLFTPGMNTLRELLKFTGSVTPIEGRSLRGDRTWELRLKSRDGQAFRVTLDPRYGYMISKSEMIFGKFVSSMHVDEFQEPKPGIFIAKLVRDNERNPDQLVEYTINDLKVNEPVPDEEFNFRFPAGIPIDDDKKNVVHIWGGGKPARTFASHVEFNNWMNTQRSGAFRKTDRSLLLKLCLVGGTTVVLVALIYLRRRMVAA